MSEDYEAWGKQYDEFVEGFVGKPMTYDERVASHGGIDNYLRNHGYDPKEIEDSVVEMVTNLVKVLKGKQDV